MNPSSSHVDSPSPTPSQSPLASLLARLGLRSLSFSSALTLAVVLLMATPGSIGAFVFLGRTNDEARESIVGELRVNAQSSFNQLRRELDLLETRARTLSFDSDLQMGTRSVLFFERIETRLAGYLAETPLSNGAWFFSQDSILVASAPRRLEALRPYPFDVPLRLWLESMRENEQARLRQRFESLPAATLLGLLSTGEGTADAKDTPPLPANRDLPALFLFTPVRDFLGATAGGIVTLVSPVAMQQSLLAPLGAAEGVKISVTFPVSLKAKTEEEVTLTHNVLANAVDSRLALHGMEFTVRQEFTERLGSVRQRSTLLVVFLSLGLAFLATSAFLLARIFVAPLDPLRGVVRAFGKGHYDVAKPSVPFMEFREFVDTLFSMSGEIRERIKEREQLARRDADLKREQMSAELGALRSQLNPHFLFNALNGVSSMLDIDTEQARGMLQQLSDLLRDILECSKLTTIPLRGEREMVERYLSLQKRRFGRRLDFSFESPGVDEGRVHVPSLMVQTLVENAVKHGVERTREGGDVLVTIAPAADGEAGYECRVRNTPKGLAAVTLPRSPSEGTGTGLENTRRRLELLYGAAGRFDLSLEEGGGATATFHFSGERLA